MKRFIALGMIILAISACTSREPDLKSPCVGTDDSPCVRRPVNDWWAHV